MPDYSILSSERGIRAVKWSFVCLMITALLQAVVVILSGSIALLADTIHNFGDAATAIPLGVAFILAKSKPSKRFTYGYGRVEDLAGIIIVLIILFSALVAGYESVTRLLHPQKIGHLYAVIAASIIGFLGNEAVAIFRIRVGKEIGSAALIADGYHARVDGWTSLAVLFGAMGVWLGYPLADPIIGLVITAAILVIVWQAGKQIFIRILDGVDPGVIDEIKETASTVEGVAEVSGIKARWIGHNLHTQFSIGVKSALSAGDVEEIVREVSHKLRSNVSHLTDAAVNVVTLKQE
ncbi:MAG: cation diffusion facilitator family transporter [Thermodesulfobacteriota bacterium]